MIIAITGPMHVGKTTLAKKILDNFMFVERAPLADGVRQVATLLKLPHVRENLQGIGHGLRDVDPDVWVNLWQSKYEGSSWHQIIDDVRYQNEIDIGNLFIRLNCDVDNQWERYLTSDKYDPAITQGQWDTARGHATEIQELTTPSDFTLWVDSNNGYDADAVYEGVADWLSPRLTKISDYTQRIATG